MFKCSKTCARLIAADVALSIVLYGLGIIVLSLFRFNISVLSFSLGMFLGTVFTVLKILLMEKTVNKAVDMPKDAAANYTRMHYTLRYFLTMAVIIVGALNKNVDIFGVVIGIIALRPAAYIAAKIEPKDTPAV